MTQTDLTARDKRLFVAKQWGEENFEELHGSPLTYLYPFRCDGAMSIYEMILRVCV